jgi:hypothetical protein
LKIIFGLNLLVFQNYYKDALRDLVDKDNKKLLKQIKVLTKNNNQLGGSNNNIIDIIIDNYKKKYEYYKNLIL